MVSYLIRRVGYALIMVVLVSFVSFVIIKLPPGDFLTQKLVQLQAAATAAPKAQIEDPAGPLWAGQAFHVPVYQLGQPISCKAILANRLSMNAR